MTYIAIYAIAILADLWTTDRALRRHSNAREAHPILSRIFGPRPSRAQFAIAALVRTAAWFALIEYGGAPHIIFLLPAGTSAWAAVSNYRAEKRQ